MTFDPLLPLPVLAAVLVAAVVVVVLWVRREAPSRLSVLRWSAMGLLLVMVAVDPTIKGGRAAIKRSDANVLFVVDTTGSMAAQDYGDGEPRLVGVRHDIGALADEFSGAHFSLITFNSKTRVILPWTTDRLALDSAAALLRQEWTLYARGSRLDEPLPTMRTLLPRDDTGDGYDIVFYLSDGEQTAEAAVRSFEVLDDAVAAGAVLGYGTTEGARMNLYVGHDEVAQHYIHDFATGTDAVSQLDEANLVRIADELGVGYVHRSAPDGVDDIAADAVGQVGSTYSGQRDTVRRLYWLPAFGLVGLVLWQLACDGAGDRRRPAGDRRPAAEGADVSERRRRTRRLLVLPIVIVLLAVSVKLITMSWLSTSGASTYNAASYERSATMFGRLGFLNVVEPWRAHFGSGTALHRTGDLDGAEAAFRRALELAPQRCDIRFNLVVTIEAQGDRLAGAASSSDDPVGAGRPRSAMPSPSTSPTAGCARRRLPARWALASMRRGGGCAPSSISSRRRRTRS